jgi:predicted  nucleic acid-binding Zn-ribbon protein
VTENLNTEKQALVEKLKAELEAMGDSLEQTNADIKTLEETIAALDKQVHETTEQRKSEHAEFVNTFATMDTARRLIDKAATRLEKFYSPKAHQAKKDAVANQALANAGLSLVASHTASPPKSLAVQRMEASFEFIQRHSAQKSKVDPITLGDTPKTYEKKESGGVIGLMNDMKSDLTAEMTAAETEEKYSAKDYTRIMKEAQETRAADVKAKNHKESIKAELESQIADAKELQGNTLKELQNLALYMVQLHTECDFLLRNFDVRHEGRVSEEVGLEDAGTIVTKAEPPDHTLVEKGFASEHSPKQVDDHFEGGHHLANGVTMHGGQ